MRAEAVSGTALGTAHRKGKGQWRGYAEGDVGYQVASTEGSVYFTGHADVGGAFQSYLELGPGGQAYFCPADSVIRCGLPQQGSGISAEVALFS